MLFHSHGFVLLFLPTAVVFFFLLGRAKTAKWSKLFLVFISFLFAGIASPLSALVLAFSTYVNFLLTILMNKSSSRKWVLILGLIFNIALLSFFKYFNFVAEHTSVILRLSLPLGISFYTFQQISYLVDNYRNETTSCSLTDYLLFTTFFPKLVQGPIASQKDLMQQLQSCKKTQFQFENFSKGLSVFAVGLAKKVLIADNFGKIVSYGYGSISSLNSFEALLTILAYTFQIYYDFSGYCDMACGIAWMFNIELPQNFNSPYKAKNISDFWKRWHMTLTSFLTKYIYFPLGGNRKGVTRTYLNILIVYLISGLWHGTGMTFLVWGLLHGLATILYRIFKKQYDRMPTALQWFLTFLFINITWVFFRANCLQDALSLMRQVFVGGWSFTINAELTETLLQPTFISVAARLLHGLPIVAVLSCGIVLFSLWKQKNSTCCMKLFQPTTWQWLKTYLLLLVSILSVSGVSTFLYSNF